MKKILNNNDKIKPLKYKESNLKRKMIIVTIVFSVLIISGMFLYKTFAAFNEQKQFNVINGEVQDSRDSYFAYYVDNKITRDIPTQYSGYTLDTTKSTCTNGVAVGWDRINWTALVNYQKYNATNNTRTKCDLYFKLKPTFAGYITTLATTDITNLAVDDYGNTRYIGKDPNNYVRIEGDEYQNDVYFGYSSTTSTSYKEYSSLDECKKATSYKYNCKVGIAKGTPILWRIIGVMKDVDDGTGNKKDRVKIIRSISIGDYSWDTSESSINGGLGVNEWSQADLMKLLNPGYESETVGGSLYWNNKSGTCYNGSENSTTSCDFTSTGIKVKLKNMIGNAVWNTGSNGTNDYTSSSNGLTKHFYTYERSTNTGKICTSGDYCTDTVSRTTTWTGKIGLMYPSDYGYATSGGSGADRATCLNKELSNWSDSSVSDCKNNDWLFDNSSYHQCTLAPHAHPSQAHRTFSVLFNSSISSAAACNGFSVRPVVYLLPSVGVQSGDGSSGNPFILS